MPTTPEKKKRRGIGSRILRAFCSGQGTVKELGNSAGVTDVAALECAMVSKIDYEQQAAECLRMAQKTTNPEQKTLLLSMAQSWRSLAQNAQNMQRLRSEAVEDKRTAKPEGD
jgi:hypothetical protein